MNRMAFVFLLISFFIHPHADGKTQLILNGSFETGDFTHWVSSGFVDVSMDSAYQALPGAVGETPFGPHFVAFGSGGSPATGVVSQDIKTGSGQVYDLIFWYGNYGSTSSGPQAMSVIVEDLSKGIALLDVTVGEPVGTTNLANVLNEFNFEFTAVGSETRIRFADVSTAGADNDGLLDNVSLVPKFSSSFPAQAAPIIRSLPQQIDTVNAGPPISGYGPVNRHADLHVQSSFDCLAGDGVIADVSGAFELLNQPPPSVLNGQLTSNTNIRVFTEMTRIATESDAVVDATEPGTYNNINNPPPPEGVVIPAGSLVSSHLLHFDTTSDTQAATLTGTVTFESDVLGVIFRGERLIFTDDADPVNGPFLGSPTTNYPSNPDRTWEIGANGFFTIGEDRRTVTAQALVQDFLDQLRIVTAASPADVLAEPYVSADQFIDDADEVTLDNCSSAWYRFTFELPPNFTSPSLSGIANVDDVAVAYLNGNRISAMVTIDDLGVDRIDTEGRPLLSWPTRDSFETCNPSHFVAGTNELVFGVVGDLSPFDPTGLEFEASVAFDETTLLGDVNQDGVVSLLDIQPFVDLLTSSEFQAEADINGDGVVSLLDVAPFVELLTGG